ncbi:hypothetical protein BIV57_13865 [Mangrovactinospora gilvigrisea]|uniref:Integral membrane protein n=1 Tax=Mangrovactinospora gilvigrisea TaxID=1428644 RepID=A0A1J7BEA8_9ACTN|nr:hypothetical protein BIV57_13865 [Mangrovactinospora gilvigrisea]
MTPRLRLVLVLLAVVAAVLLSAPHAHAAPSPTPSPSPSSSSSSSNSDCNLLPGPAKTACEGGNPNTGSSGSGGGTSNPIQSATDPLGALASGCAQAASWVITHLSSAIDGSTQVDFTNAGFLRQYAVVFAASTVLTLVLWLLAVTKRAVRGIPLHEAITEAIGYLWLTVVASAFTPLVLFTLVKVTDALTAAIALGTNANTSQFLGGFAKSLDPNKIGGGPIMTIVVSLFSVLAAAFLWIELLIRAAMLYVGALLGTAVYSGLVDKKLWQHVRRWAGLMIAVILLKPIIVIVLSLAGAVGANDATGSGGARQDSFSAILSGLAILVLSIFASVMIYRFVPGFGDDMAALHRSRTNPAARIGSAMVTGPANLVRQGINAHAARNTAAEAASGSVGKGGSGDAVAGGVSAHGSRGGGGGSAPAQPASGSAPTPRQAPSSAQQQSPSAPRSADKPSGGDR